MGDRSTHPSSLPLQCTVLLALCRHPSPLRRQPLLQLTTTALSLVFKREHRQRNIRRLAPFTVSIYTARPQTHRCRDRPLPSHTKLQNNIAASMDTKSNRQGGKGSASSESATAPSSVPEDVMLPSSNVDNPPAGASCWWCLEEGPNEAGQPLVRDCSCRGSSGL